MSLTAASIVAAYVEGSSMILLVAAVSALIFWLVEAYWKVAQQAYYPRIWEIEHAFSENGTKLAPLQIASSWSKAWRAGGLGSCVQGRALAACYAAAYCCSDLWLSAVPLRSTAAWMNQSDRAKLHNRSGARARARSCISA